MRTSFGLGTAPRIILDSLRILDRTDQKKFFFVILIQIIMAGFDLLAVLIVGVMGALAVSGFQSSPPGAQTSDFLELLNLEGMTIQEQVAILGIVAAGLLIGKTIFSIYFTRKSLRFFGRRGAIVSSDLFKRVIGQQLTKLNNNTLQHYIFTLTGSVGAITVGIFGSLITLISDIAVLFVLATGLFVVEPILASATFAFFGLVGLALYKIMAGTSQSLGAEASNLNIESNEIMSEALSTFREIAVGHRKNFYVSKFHAIRLRIGNVAADIAFLPNISKYVIESALVIGVLAMGGFVFISKDATNAVANIALFIAAGSRIAPAVLRLQQSLISIQGSFGAAGPALKLLEELPKIYNDTATEIIPDYEYADFEPRLEIRDVTLFYEHRKQAALSEVNFEINSGEVIAIAGSSGAGKTSLVDVVLGLIDPSIGEVLISGLSPKQAIARWPGAIGYVPQDVMITNGTIRQNVALGFPEEVATDEMVERALERAQILSFVKSLSNGLDSFVGDRGTQISGGQRQRIGIARALFTNPKLLVLDEATSTLDGETEYRLSESWHELKGSVTVLMIAHRLSSIRNADRIVYLDNGRIASIGTFDQVRTEVKDFANQVRRMGIKD